MIKRFALPAAGAAILLSMLASDRVRPASAASPSTPQDVNIVGPLDPSGAVETVVSKVKGIVTVRLNPALTAVGQPPSETVVLTGFPADLGYVPLTEVRSDGSQTAFTAVPAGKSLIITDIHWNLRGETEGSQALLEVDSPSPLIPIFEQLDLHNAAGTASGHVTLTAGIAFGPGRSVSVYFPGSGGQVFLYGYYVPTS